MNLSTATPIILFYLKLHNSLFFRKTPHEPDRQQQRLPLTNQPNAVRPTFMLDAQG